ncbi:MAG: hypothetical protein J6P87_07530 [Lachnospiraceae bacterium]|nr:hypothetical protein [Lachnospiraceae bacterium]
MKKSLLLVCLLTLALTFCACSKDDAKDAEAAQNAVTQEAAEEKADPAPEVTEAAEAPAEEEAEAVEAPAEEEKAEAAEAPVEEEPEAAEEPEAPAEETAEETATEETKAPEEAPAPEPEVRRTINIPQRGLTDRVADGYALPAAEQGSLMEIEYRTHDYVNNNEKAVFIKPAYVYLPYGYDKNDPDTRYDIFYYLCGIENVAEDLFLENGGATKNMFDNMIMNGDMKPMIIVSLTIDRDNSKTDFDSAVLQLMKFDQEFVNDIMPAVESEVKTYAKSTSKEDLAASRDHRGFGGFSLGSVTTWNQFCTNSDYISYFLPICGPCWYVSGAYSEEYDETVNDTLWFLADHIRKDKLDERGYFIYVCIGENDLFRPQVDFLMEPMLEKAGFFPKEHVVYYMKEGGEHDFAALVEYLYNALKLFF